MNVAKIENIAKLPICKLAIMEQRPFILVIDFYALRWQKMRFSNLTLLFIFIFLSLISWFFVLFRFESYYNYCSLFNCILTSGSPVTLDLPNQWLWEIIDEFIYQFQSFVQFRAKLGKKTSEELDILRQNPRTWDVLQVPKHFF